MRFTGVLFHKSRMDSLLVPCHVVVEDRGRPPSTSNGCQSVRPWPELQTLVPLGRVQSPSSFLDSHSHCGSLKRREGILERTVLYKFYLI
jgi:hypothetical protein